MQDSILLPWPRSVQVGAWYWPPVLLVVGIACMLGVYHEKAEPRGAPDLSGRDFTVSIVGVEWTMQPFERMQKTEEGGGHSPAAIPNFPDETSW